MTSPAKTRLTYLSWIRLTATRLTALLGLGWAACSALTDFGDYSFAPSNEVDADSGPGGYGGDGQGGSGNRGGQIQGTGGAQGGTGGTQGGTGGAQGGTGGAQGGAGGLTCLPSPESCNGRDDNCNGLTDEELPSLTCGVGACMRSVPSCMNGVTQICVPAEPMAAEICNNIDDDCDGATDEELGQTTCGVGACRRTVQNCANGVPQTCVPGVPSREICGDNIDNNCDDIVDRVPLLLLSDNVMVNTNMLSVALMNAGFHVHTIDSGVVIYNGIPPAMAFATVLLLVGELYERDMPLIGQESIVRAFTTGTTGVVLTEWASSHVASNRWRSLRQLLLFQYERGSQGQALTFTQVAQHPVWSNVIPVFTVGPNAVGYALGTIINDAVPIGRFTATHCQDCPAVLVRETSTRTVHFTHSASYGWSAGTTGNWVAYPPLVQLMINAARWTARCEP